MVLSISLPTLPISLHQVANPSDWNRKTRSTKCSSSPSSPTSLKRTFRSSFMSDNSVCGSWPAFWTANLNNWPAGGEIDILEGVNTDSVNHVALHTTSNFLITPDQQTGNFDALNCDVNAAGQANNAGCGGYSGLSTSYGDGFNNGGGGVYAMDWRRNGIRVWQFPRSNIPADIKSGKPTTANWGVPDYDFSGRGANIASHFNDHKII